MTGENKKEQEFHVKVAELATGKRFVLQNGNAYELFTDHCPQPFNCHWQGGDGWLVEIYLPDYPNDLNACAESFEKEILEDDRRWSAYERELGTAIATSRNRWGPLWSATARERCIAFVKTMEGVK